MARVYCLVQVAKNVTLLNDYIFSNCEQLSEVSLSKGITEIKRAFHNCQSHERFTLPSTVKKIEPFRECTALKEIYIPASVEEIDSHVLNGCTALEKITVDENNPYIVSLDCRAVLAMTVRFCHCEECNDEAISLTS